MSTVGRYGTQWRGPGSGTPRWRGSIFPVAMLVVLSTCACSSMVQHDSAPPVGLIATTTPWAGSFNSVDLPLPVNSITSVSCPTKSSCWATGSTEGGGGNALGAAILATRNGGATWTPESIPNTIGYLSSISCRDASHCVAVGETTTALGMEGVALVTSDGGRVWAGPPPIAGTTDITAVTCGPSGGCLAVASGSSGAVAVTLEPDGTWQTVGPLPPGTSGATDVSCADDEHCWVTGATTVGADNIVGSVAYTTDFGATWTAVPVPPGTGMLNGLSCSSSAKSAGSLPFGATSTTVPPAGTTTTGSAPGAPSGAPSTTVVPPTTTTTLPGVPGFDCTAVGTTSTTLDAPRAGHGLILRTTSGGSTWTAERVPATAASFTDISCPTAGSCAAVGTSVATAPEAGLVVLTGDGNIWKHAATVAVPQPVAAVSCASVGHCVMAGEAVSEWLDAS
ncbi:MAG: hypothetical protein WBG41_06105 [Acidimicrobiales bacterium]